MANNNIFIEKDVNNIFIVNPNKVTNQFGNAEDRNVPMEDLVYYVNLDCDIKPRSRLIGGVKGNDNTTQTTTQIAYGKINFLKPNDQDYLTTKWSQLQTDVNDPNTINGELLGLKTVTYKVNASFVPTITITLEDSKGRALMESGDNSLYSAFFNLPYPTFHLTIKGYYGKAIRYPIILQKFNSSFNSSTGNFELTLNFIAYQFNVLTDITMASLFAVPQMYLKRTTTNIPLQASDGQTAAKEQLSPQTQTTNEYIQQKGMDKLKEVYKKYKTRNLIDQNVPELTIQELITKLDNFINYSLEQFGQVSLSALNDVKEYSDIITSYRKAIYTGRGTSWFDVYLSKTKFFIKNGDVNENQQIEPNEIKFYTFSDTKGSSEILTDNDTVNTRKIDGFKELGPLIESFNEKLLNNATFGKNGKYPITVDIKLESVAITLPNSPNLKRTYQLRNPSVNDVTDENIKKIQTEIDDLHRINDPLSSAELKYYYFDFDSPNQFNDQLNKIQDSLQDSSQKIEKELTDELSKFIASATGLGFVPSLKNIMGVILASAEAFLLLMDDVHVAAYQVRNNKKKQTSVGNVDIKGLPDSPVYPWPLYTRVKECNKYEIKYPGDNDVINDTRAYDYEIWPEVEFVEEFLKGYMQRQTPPSPVSPLEPTSEVKRIMVSAFDTIPTNIPYSNLEEVSFFYEFYERLISLVEYNGFLRKKLADSEYSQQLINYLSDSEGTNIVNSILTSSPSLVSKFTNTPFTDNGTFQVYLKSISNNGTGLFWNNKEAGIFNTTYLKEKIIDTPSEILISDLPSIKITLTKTEPDMTKYMSSSVHDSKNIFDLLPYSNENWRVNNLSNGESEFSFENSYNKTKESLFYNTYTKKISNYLTPLGYGTNNEKNLIKPFTNFKPFYNTITSPIDLTSFYNDRKPKNYILTEGRTKYSTNEETTSMMNTPYFINAVQEGINNLRNNTPYPFKAAAYLFLNSLPLSTLREKYLSFENNENVHLNFISASLNKFSGVHSLPKIWVCKIGSIWHRYKNYILNDSDILTSIWTNFDVLNNYYPTSNPTLDYLYYLSGQTVDGNNYEYKIKCSGSTGTSSGTLNEINLGFYPKIINDFYYLIYNQNLFLSSDTITQITEKINTQIKLGNLILLSPSDSSFQTVKTWSVLIKNPFFKNYYVLPSFGLGKNQLQNLYSNNISAINTDGNLFNGSVRLLWGAPNYGYFNNTNIVKPTVRQHLKKVYNDLIEQESFELRTDSDYSSIEEIFGVFTKTELDLFEAEFLRFSEKKEAELSPINFQKILLNITSNNYIVSGSSENDLVEGIQKLQLNSLNTLLPPLMTNNTLFKKGNTTGFDLPTFNYFSNSPSNPKINVDLGYTGNLPPGFTGSTITLQQSQEQNPKSWKELQLQVGFSTINGVSYTDEGSALTDFFVDFNIPFNVENVQRFTTIIKMYASYKHTTTIQNVSDLFKGKISDVLLNNDNLYIKLFEGVTNYVKKNLPQTDTTQVQEIDSVIQGFQSKIELYDMFKAVNDKWVSANDYNEKTLFEDFLFLDRANRDIGGEIYLDINSITKFLKNTSPKTNVFTILDSIFKTHNFITFSMPSYINFYNNYTPSKTSENKQEDPDSFSNSLFGIFKSVDYQKTAAKLVSIYTEKPSTQLNNKSKNNGYKDDGLNIMNDGDTLRECDTSKVQDFAKSNKVVGFAVDFNLQNQSVFETINVSQDLGKATSESLTAEFNLANGTAGTNSSTQNVSLYNIYKDRSYSCSVDGFGNAMIQPTMYFVLRNVPLFAGSYYITEVTHTISTENFKTSFTGTRQNKYTLPKVENTFQTLKTELLKTLNKNYNNKIASNASLSQNKNNISAQITNGIKNNDKVANVGTCSSMLFADYQTYVALNTPITAYQPDSVVINIGDSTTTTTEFFTVYLIFKIASYVKDDKNNSSFNATSFNFADITLDIPYKGDLSTLFLSNFVCVAQSDKTTKPYAVFNNIFDCITLVKLRYTEYFKEIFDDSITINQTITDFNQKNDVQKLEFKEQFAKAWIEYFPYNKVKEYPSIFKDYKENNPTEYKELLDKIEFQL